MVCHEGKKGNDRANAEMSKLRKLAKRNSTMKHATFKLPSATAAMASPNGAANSRMPIKKEMSEVNVMEKVAVLVATSTPKRKTEVDESIERKKPKLFFGNPDWKIFFKQPSPYR